MIIELRSLISLGLYNRKFALDLALFAYSLFYFVLDMTASEEHEELKSLKSRIAKIKLCFASKPIGSILKYQE